jgi:hypothetical protein
MRSVEKRLVYEKQLSQSSSLSIHHIGKLCTIYKVLNEAKECFAIYSEDSDF